MARKDERRGEGEGHSSVNRGRRKGRWNHGGRAPAAVEPDHCHKLGAHPTSFSVNCLHYTTHHKLGGKQRKVSGIIFHPSDE